jgi:hypothetical protein
MIACRPRAEERAPCVDTVSFAVRRDRDIAEAFVFDRKFEMARFALVTNNE